MTGVHDLLILDLTLPGLNGMPWTTPAIGTDTLIASAVCERAERRAECVLMPPLAMAPTMAWAAGPEEGEIDFDPEVFFVSVASTSYSTIRVPTGWSPYASNGQQGRSYGRPCTSGDRLGVHRRSSHAKHLWLDARWLEFCVQGWLTELSR